MLENPTNDSSASANVAPVKRYAPPNQRNRGLGRRKSGGDRLERGNSYTSDGDKAQVGFPRDTNSSYRGGEFSSVALIPLHGCSNSEAAQLLNDRWAAAMNALNSLPDNSSEFRHLPFRNLFDRFSFAYSKISFSICCKEKPILYTRSGVSSPWGHPILPHLMMQPAASAGLKKDFFSELRQAIHNANGSSTT
ncbi:OLC1v1006530C1 [Oldenlandia corymbosa var. corymbosa]|uniref:OLC1v1006530C1 n=1 Tax=Oldenlandia corymbosa var. corymbosa TaxID=529605 RepID=A0AAV1DJN7_OLDCO|nr:OLC1v1006530C1 [Oldenlandia corymbosa var. corymbosa]